MQLSIAIPCFNEEENISDTVKDIAAWFARRGIDGEIVAVDDGSRDATWEKLCVLQKEYPFLKLVRHEENKGYGSAVRSGCDRATKEYVGYMDSDRQFHVEDFDHLLPHLEQYAFVTGRRQHRADPFVRKMNAKLFGLLTFAVLGVWVRDINCAMKVWKRDIWKTIRPTFSTGALINAEIFYRLRQNGIPWKQVPVRHFPRLRGVQTGANIRVILRMFRDLFRMKRACLVDRSS
jgi:glycosyltransferase involved in cell wall biosynthesis